MTFPTVKLHPHASQTRAIVLAMLKMPKPRQREMFSLAIAYLHAQCGEQVGTLHDFTNAPPDEIFTLEVKERILGHIAKAMKTDDASLLQP